MRDRAINVRWLARIAGTLAIVIGLVHLAVGVSSHAHLTFDALWFQGSGLAVVLIGVLTVLSASERAWRTLVFAAGLANTGGLALAVAFVVLAGWREPQGTVLIVVFGTGALSAAGSLVKR